MKQTNWGYGNNILKQSCWDKNKYKKATVKVILRANVSRPSWHFATPTTLPVVEARTPPWCFSTRTLTTFVSKIRHGLVTGFCFKLLWTICRWIVNIFNTEKEPSVVVEKTNNDISNLCWFCRQPVIEWLWKACVCVCVLSFVYLGVQEKGNQLFAMMICYSPLCTANSNKHPNRLTWVWVSLMLWMWGNIRRLSFLWEDFKDVWWLPTPKTC